MEYLHNWERKVVLVTMVFIVILMSGVLKMAGMPLTLETEIVKGLNVNLVVWIVLLIDIILIWKNKI